VIARTDQGRLPIRPAELDVALVLGGVADRFAQRARDRGVELTVSGDGTVVADMLRLEQALGNLVDNALRHGASHVELVAVEGAERVELHVRDDGDGFPPAFLDSAFERFTRADTARARGGAGLGLSIVDAIARAHDGGAAGANRPDGGADVWIVIPTRRAAPGS
jgi:signal transduction histidine kinase